ncbi:hypothetical protein OROGR_008307 [Orobanche gracilis]
MGSSSAILRRWMSSISVEGVDYFNANRISPWLMLPPVLDGIGNIAYKFHCLANQELHYKNKIGGGELQLAADIDNIEFVGSSHGWLALQSRQNYDDLFLSNPIIDRHIKLPTLGALGPANRLILSSSLSPEEEEDEPLALMNCRSNSKLAFCSPRRRTEWTVLGSDRDYTYQNLVYSSRHKRLFCVRRPYYNGNICLECWDVVRRQRDWVIQDCNELSFGGWTYTEYSQLNYLVCAEDTGDLFLVVRHVNPRVGPYGSMVDKVILCKDRGSLLTRNPYKTIDFDVYKIDVDGGKVDMYMEDSLQGLAMFVGINHPFVIPAAEVSGVMPDSVYFTDENDLVEQTKHEPTTGYGGHDNGIFDYRNKDFYKCCDLYPIEYEKITRILPPPLWFTPQCPKQHLC